MPTFEQAVEADFELAPPTTGTLPQFVRVHSGASAKMSPVGPGASLSRLFFFEEVQPVVDEALGDIGYLAARLGSGSDVLGFDDQQSTDHDFGCRLTLLVDDEAQHLVDVLDHQLEIDLPEHVAGHPVRFPTTWDPRVRHKIDIYTVHDFTASRLGTDLRTMLSPVQWLCLTGQSVLEVTSGPVFHDTTVAYQRVVETLRWYPDDLWYYVLAAGWSRLSQELPFVGRTGQRQDDLGSRIITARLSRDLVHLAFLLARTWPPYPKWANTALREVPAGIDLAKALEDAAAAETWQHRQEALATGVELLADQQRHLGLPTPADAVHQFFDRPFITTTEQLVTELVSRIGDDTVRGLPRIGSIEQWSDNVDLLSNPMRRVRAADIYRSHDPAPP